MPLSPSPAPRGPASVPSVSSSPRPYSVAIATTGDVRMMVIGGTGIGKTGEGCEYGIDDISVVVISQLMYVITYNCDNHHITTMMFATTNSS